MRSLASLVREALKAIKKNPLKTDLQSPGVGTPSKTGKSYHSNDGTYSTSGSGYTTQGSKGWSRTGDGFEVPEDSIPLDKSAIEDDALDETEELWKDSPVGLPVPEFNGGRAGAGIRDKWRGNRKNR